MCKWRRRPAVSPVPHARDHSMRCVGSGSPDDDPRRAGGYASRRMEEMRGDMGRYPMDDRARGALGAAPGFGGSRGATASAPSRRSLALAALVGLALAAVPSLGAHLLS